MGFGRIELPGEVEELRGRIATWRGGKASPVERMPAGLWSEAAGWARRFGASAVIRALGIGYVGLRQRLGEAAEPYRGTEVRGGGFVELGTWAGPPAAGCGPMRVEVDRADGCQIRLEVTAGGVEAAATLLRAFLGQAG